MDGNYPSEMPSHGGNTGSNPVGDAKVINRLGDRSAAKGAVYGKYTAKLVPDADRQARTDAACQPVGLREPKWCHSAILPRSGNSGNWSTNAP
jgi:hypothetical protein